MSFEPRLLVILGIALFATNVAAEDRDAAKRLLDEGNVLLKTGQYEAALSKYREAYEAYPRPKIRLNIAEVHRQLGQSLASLEQYEAFVAEADESLSRFKDGAEERIKELTALIGLVAISGELADAKVTIDGVVRRPPFDGIRADPGRHELQIDRAGYARFSAVAQVRSGQTEKVEVVWVADQTIVPIEPVEEDPLYARWWLWAIVGAVVVGGTVGIVAATNGTEAFLPSGELGVTRASSWSPF